MKNLKKILFISGAILLLILGFIYYFINPVIKFNFLFNGVSICLIIILVLITGAIKTKTLITINILLILSLILTNLFCSPVFRADSYRQIGGNVKQNQFKKEIKEVDLKNIPIIDKEYAMKIADKKIGEISGLGSKSTIGTMTLQLVGKDLYYVAPLEPTGFFAWKKNRGTEGYIMVDAMKINEAKLVTKLNNKSIKIKYSENAFFNDNIQRHSYFAKKNIGLTDYSFEIDDKGNPYWVISAYDKVIGVQGEKTVGVLIVDAQTGKSKYYNDLSKVPSWVDRIQPMEFMNEQFNWWGKYIHGFWNFSNNDMLVTTKGMGIIYLEGQCYYYSGVTSTGSDESSTGFVLINSRTGQKSIYKKSGATEQAGMKSAEGKVKNFGYSASFPYLINVNGEPTYFTPLKDDEGLIKQYAMVNVAKYNIVGVGNTIEETYSNYISSLNTNDDNSTNLNDNGNLTKETLTIDRIGSVISQNELVFYMTTIEYPNTLFIVSQNLSKETSLSKPSDKVTVSYIKNDKISSINVSSFDNLNINITK